MASIKVDVNEFADIVSLFILDYIMSDNMIIDNDKWETFIDHTRDRGLKTELVKYYISTSGTSKNKYKEIKRIFTKEGKGKKATINITNEYKEKPKEKGKLKSLLKKTVKLIKSHKYRHYGMPLNEDTIDKILDHVLTEAINDGIIDNNERGDYE